MYDFFNCLWRPRSIQTEVFIGIDTDNDDYPLITKSRPTPSLYNRIKGWATNLTEKMTLTGTLGTAVYYNIVRDVTWGYITYHNNNLKLNTADTWTEANNTQWLYGTAAMCIAMLPQYLACRTSGQHMPWTSAFISIIAASLAIPGWNIAAKLGTNLGKQHLGMSTISAGYFAGLFTGLAEGPIQEAVTSLGQYLTSLEEKEKYRDSPSQYFIQFLKRLMFSATFGTIPGDVWQFIYNAGKTNDIGSIPTSITIAAGAALSNVLYDKFKSATLLKPTMNTQDSQSRLLLTPIS